MKALEDEGKAPSSSATRFGAISGAHRSPALDRHGFGGGDRSATHHTPRDRMDDAEKLRGWSWQLAGFCPRDECDAALAAAQSTQCCHRPNGADY
jgi:hypothetical protein